MLCYFFVLGTWLRFGSFGSFTITSLLVKCCSLIHKNTFLQDIFFFREVSHFLRKIVLVQFPPLCQAGSKLTVLLIPDMIYLDKRSVVLHFFFARLLKMCYYLWPVPSSMLNWGTVEAIESGQKRCRGRVCGVFFLVLGISVELASSIGCRIRLRALMNL